MIDFPIIDSHIHLLDQKRFGYAWSNGAPALKRDWTPDDLASSAKPCEIEGLVFVEVDVDMPKHLDEAEWVDGLAKHDRRVLGAVACLPLERGKEIEPEMARVAKLKTARGVRSRMLTSIHGDQDLAYRRSRRTISSNFTRLRPFTCQRPVIPGFASSTRPRCHRSYASTS